MELKVSPGNIKMGAIPSVSLPAGLTCIPGCICYLLCYARKLERLRPSVRNAYMNNYELLLNDPDKFWMQVEEAVKKARFFRFHVSGDIPDASYFGHMVDVAARNPHCDILCFTKKYAIVNDAIANGMVLPKNLHVLFSVWRDIPYENPYELPEAHIRYRDGFTTSSPSAVECGGNCTNCAVTDGGCWGLRSGGQVVINQH